MFRSLVFAALLIFCAGCDLSKYPIDDPAVVKIDTRLIGKWRAQEEGKHYATYTLSRMDDFHYRISSRIKVKRSVQTDEYQGFLSEIDNVPFLNVFYKDDSGNGGYSILKVMDVRAKSIVVASIKDSTLKNLNSPKEVRERITNNLNNPLFFMDTTTLIRVK